MSCSLKLKSAELQTCASLSPTQQLCCGTGSLQHQTEQKYPQKFPQQRMDTAKPQCNARAHFSPEPEVQALQTATALPVGLSLKGRLSAKLLSGKELLFSSPLTIKLHRYTVLVDLCLLNSGISASNVNYLFKHCCFNTVTDSS